MSQPDGNGGRVVLWLLAVLGVLLAGSYAALCVLAGDKVPPGTTVSGVDIGGLHQAAAETRLRRELGPRSRQAITVTGGGLSTEVDPARAGLRVDVPGSVLDAGGGQRITPSHLWHYVTGGEEVDARLDVDGSRLEDTVTGLAERVDKQPVDGTLGFAGGRPVVTAAVDGRRLVRAGARDALARAFPGSTSAALPVTTLRPKVTDAAVHHALVSYARPAASGPVDLVLDGHAVQATPLRFAGAISFKKHGKELVPSLDVHDLLTALGPVLTTVAGAPQPARIVVEHGKPVIRPAKAGVSFDPKDLRRKFLATVVKPREQRRAIIRAVPAQPSFSTADARRLGVTEKVSSFRTRFAHADYRNTNLSRGAELVDGTLLKPGDTFSLNKTIGRPTVHNGFTPGYVISDGILEPDIGLGRLATTIYNAAFFAGLDDVQHAVHTVYDHGLPMGRQVSLAYGKDDLRLRNDSPYGVLVTARVAPSSRSADGTVTVSMWSTRRWHVTAEAGNRYAQKEPGVLHRQGTACEAAAGRRGFSVDVLRLFHRPGSSVVDHQERTTSVYEPSSTVVCDKP
ncbi:MAG: VanW family protein [Marmoricola sp.]